jgi:phospholipid/cholesterol/gamma-HCH transport system substrate-binding protein
MAALGSRRNVAVMITLTAVTLAAIGTGCTPLDDKRQATYCALLPDSIGLYVGNPVTQMGYPVGKVTTIAPAASEVRVDFTVSQGRKLPLGVKALIRSTSILADRSLELVGNYESGPTLTTGGCIPLSQSSTPKSLSEVIGSATNFVNSVAPNGSSNVGDVVRGLDQAVHNEGPGINGLLTASSELLDNPDQAISDIGSIVANLAQLTSQIKEVEGPIKEILYDARTTTPDLLVGVDGARRFNLQLAPFVTLIADLEIYLGDETQFTLDAVSTQLRWFSHHTNFIADVLNPVPWYLNVIANHYNSRPFPFIRYRPPLYRVRTPDGVATCNVMNASMPGSCANVQGTPYAVDVALLQYVLTQAAAQR